MLPLIQRTYKNILFLSLKHLTIRKLFITSLTLTLSQTIHSTFLTIQMLLTKLSIIRINKRDSIPTLITPNLLPPYGVSEQEFLFADFAPFKIAPKQFSNASFASLLAGIIYHFSRNPVFSTIFTPLLSPWLSELDSISLSCIL